MKNIIKSTTFLAIVACWLWSTAFVGVKIGLEYQSPFQFAGIRFFISGVLIFIYFGKPRKFLLELKKNWKFIVDGSSDETPPSGYVAPWNAPSDYYWNQYTVGSPTVETTEFRTTNNVTVGGLRADDTVATIGTDTDVVFSHSTDDGQTWSDPSALNSNADADSGLDYVPQIATDGSGFWAAVWMSSDSLDGLIGRDLDVLSSLSTDGGYTWTAPSPLNTNAQVDSGGLGLAPVEGLEGGIAPVAVQDVEQGLLRGISERNARARTARENLAQPDIDLLLGGAVIEKPERARPYVAEIVGRILRP